MLTIKNHYKLCGKPIGMDGWKVDFCSEQSTSYQIKLEHPHLSSVKVYLMREASKMSNGRDAYMFRDVNGELTSRGVTLDWISNMDNLLKALNSFTC